MEESSQNNNNNKEENPSNKEEIKESSAPLESEGNKEEKEKENIDSMLMTKIGLIKESDEKEDYSIYNLNNPEKKVEDQKNNLTVQTDAKDKKLENETFYQKTKRWAWTIWSYVNIVNYFPKEEFTEYRNVNGDIVRIPKKKIPLKKKVGNEETDEEHIVNNATIRDNSRLNLYAADTVPMASHFL